MAPGPMQGLFTTPRRYILLTACEAIFLCAAIALGLWAETASIFEIIWIVAVYYGALFYREALSTDIYGLKNLRRQGKDGAARETSEWFIRRDAGLFAIEILMLSIGIFALYTPPPVRVVVTIATIEAAFAFIAIQGVMLYVGVQMKRYRTRIYFLLDEADSMHIPQP